MHVKALVLLKPCLHFRVIMRGIVVHDQMQLKMFGRFAIDLFEKSQPLLMPATRAMLQHAPARLANTWLNHLLKHSD